MKNFDNQTAILPTIVKYSESGHNGIQTQVLSRYAIGYILRGTKQIYNGDKRLPLKRGDIFYLNIGHHYVENIPEGALPFEQIVFYYTPQDLQQILMRLNMTYNINIANKHSCDACSDRSMASERASNALRSLFNSINNYLRDEEQCHTEAADNIKLTELIFLILTSEDNCIKNRILSSVDTSKESFEQIVHNHIFKDISIDELSELTHRSLTSFKKEFKRIFKMPPHRWFIRQRLMHSRLLLISTSKSISEIGIECTFPNTSHFIKLFKKEYQLTPASYRQRHLSEQHHTSDDVELSQVGIYTT